VSVVGGDDVDVTGLVGVFGEIVVWAAALFAVAAGEDQAGAPVPGVGVDGVAGVSVEEVVEEKCGLGIVGVGSPPPRAA
jgi:hypothetical protein